MLNTKGAFSGFSVNDEAAAKKFYTDMLGLTLLDEAMGLTLRLPGSEGSDSGKIFVYEKKDHQPATYTMLNLVVTDIDEAVDELMEQGVKFEQYKMPGIVQDEKGIARTPKDSPEYGPPIAWFKDPAGNILSVLEDKK